MQMLKHGIYLLAIILLFACNKGTLPPINGTNSQNAQIITIDIPITSVKQEKMRTDNKLYSKGINGYKNYLNTKAVLAAYSDHGGTIETAFYSQVLLPKDNFSFGNAQNIEIDSAYIALDYASNKIDSTFFGDKNSKFSFIVNEIDEDLKAENTPYFSDKVVAYKHNNLFAGDAIKINAGEKINVPNIENGEHLGDKEVDAHIRIKLSNDYVLNKFLLANQAYLANQQEFVNYFKGFRIVAKAESPTGGLINFSTYSPDKLPMRLIIYYHEKTDNGNYYKEVQLPLAVASEASGGIFYSYIKNTIDPSLNSDGGLYLVPLSGLKLKLDFAKLYDSLGSYKNNITINSAQLIADLDTNYKDSSLLPPSNLTINRGYNNNGNAINIPDGNMYDYRPINNLDGALRKNYSYYNFNLQKSTYDLLVKNITGNSIFIDFPSSQNSINLVKISKKVILKVIYTAIR